MIRTIFFKVMFLFLVFSSVNLTVYFLPFSEIISTLNQVLLKCIKLHLIMKEFLLQLNCIPHCTRSYTLSLYKVVISGCIFVCQELLNRFASNFDLGSWESNINVLLGFEILNCMGRLLKRKFSFPVKIEDLWVNGGNNYEHPVSAVQLQRMYFISNLTFSIYSTFSPI